MNGLETRKQAKSEQVAKRKSDLAFYVDTCKPNIYIDATRGRSIPQEFIAYHVVPVVKKEKPLQDTFAETLCYNIMLGEVILPLVASMYV